ncbi:transporter [Pontibacter sp. KCTC 32443]|nr:transporter [Pontibacter sp. KCTC 32443]
MEALQDFRTNQKSGQHPTSANVWVYILSNNQFFVKAFWLLLICVGFSGSANSQELEARAYANLPKDLNAVALGYAYTKGSVAVDASLPIEDFTLTAHTYAFRYVRTFGVAHKLARMHVTVPYVDLAGQAKVIGQDTSIARNGLGDTRVQIGINLIGSPALERKDFVKYTQKTIVGITLTTSIPTGQYYTDKRINLGTHRWAFKPEIGASKKINQVYADAYVGMWFYESNPAYLETKILKQEPLLSTQAHVSYYFKNQSMIGIDGNWFKGGKVSIDDIPSGRRIDHWRVGATCAVPFAGKHVVKLQFHTSVYSGNGTTFDVLSFGYQYVFF